MSSLFHIKQHTIEASHIREYPRATSTAQDDVLLQHVKQYTPKSNPHPQRGDITIIGAHANGFPKELYEPLWEDLYHQLQRHGIRIRQILIADCAWQGQSGILNKDKLGNDPSWLDYTRDIVHMINLFRPTPPLIGIGHSFGGAAIVNAALSSPRLFTAVVLLDPVISRFSTTPGDIKNSPGAMSLQRRHVWPSRDVAAQSFKKSPFYQTWDDRVLKLWLEYGLVPATTTDTPAGDAQKATSTDEAVTLATTKHQEVFTYLRPSWMAFSSDGKTFQDRQLIPDLQPMFDGQDQKYSLTWPFYRAEPTYTLEKLPHLRPSAYYIFGGKSMLSPLELQQEKLSTTGVGVGGSGGLKEGRVAGVTESEAGHLIPLEMPYYCAEHTAPWLKTELDRWWVEEREYEQWTQKPQQDKSSVSDEYARYLGRPIKDRARNTAKL